jgi:DivIVA domain-containing protein
VDPEEIASKEFPVVMRGYVREEVQAFLAGVAAQIAERDARIAQLDAELVRCQQEMRAAPAQSVDRSSLLRHLGEEAASILSCADASAERIKAQAGLAAERVRHDLRNVGSSLTDVHQLLGELVSLVQGLTEETTLVSVSPEDVTLPDACATETTTQTAGESAGDTDSEVRTVLGEVLGLETARPEIHLPDETGVTGTNPGT